MRDVCYRCHVTITSAILIMASTRSSLHHTKAPHCGPELYHGKHENERAADPLRSSPLRVSAEVGTGPGHFYDLCMGLPRFVSCVDGVRLQLPLHHAALTYLPRPPDPRVWVFDRRQNGPGRNHTRYPSQSLNFCKRFRLCR